MESVILHARQKRSAVAAMVLLCALASGELQAATATAIVDARIVLTMSIATVRGLSFGALSSGAGAASVTIQPDGTLLTINGIAMADTASAGAASFLLNGQPNRSFSIQLPASVQLSDPTGNTMTVHNFQSRPAVTGQLDGAGALLLTVGGTMEVGALQPAGSYSGLMAVSVNY